MRQLHLLKAIEAYSGARLVMKNDMKYPSYVLIKEALRGTLAYIAETTLNIEISEKTKLSKLLGILPDTIINAEAHDAIMVLIEAEREDLSAIMSIDMEKLNRVRTITKKLIGEYLNHKL